MKTNNRRSIMMKTMKSRASMEANQHKNYNENKRRNQNKNKITARCIGNPLRCPKKRKGVGNLD